MAIVLATGFKLAWGTVERVPAWVPALPILLFVPAALAGIAWFIAAVHRVNGLPWWRAVLQGLILAVLGSVAVQFVLFSLLQ